MKTKFMAFGLMIMALNLASCTTDDINGGFSGVDNENMITHSVYVDSEPWDGGSRSVYEPGVGIHLDGTETMSVYYSAASDTEYVLQDPVKATPSGDGIYTFSHAAVAGAEAYDYYFMMPYLVTSKRNSAGTASYHRIGPVQRPSAGTFDPCFDYIVGKPVKGVAADDNSASVTQFKRIMAPLRLRLMDGAGVLANQKIRQVTIAFDDTVDKGSGKCLSGLFYYKYSEDVAENHISGWQDGSFSNMATADYPAGLEQSGQWETWLMVNPVRLTPAGMTVTVVADNVRITRTIPLADKTFDIVDNKINSLNINVTGDGYKAESAFSADFTQYTKVPSAPEMSDGVEHGMTLANCTYSVQEGIGNALRLKNAANNGSITLPALPNGAAYKAIYITENTNNTTKSAPVTVKCGDTEVATGDFSYYGQTSQNGGVLELAIPSAYAKSALTIEHTCADALWINRITVTYEGGLVSPDDYYSAYTSGEDITVGGVTYKAGEYNSVLIDATGGDVDIRGKINNVAEKTILFLDTEGDYKCYTASTTNISSDIVLIGRYRDRKANFQPQMNWKLASTDANNPAGVSWINLNIDAGLDIATSNNSYLLNNSGSTEDADKFVVVDCNVDNLKKFRIYQASAVNCIIKHIVFKNSKLQFDLAMSADAYFFDFKACARMGAMETFTIENNLIYNKTGETAWLRIIAYTNATAQTEDAQHLDFAFKGNTIVNMIGRQIYFKLACAKTFTIADNIYYANEDYAADKANSCHLCFYGVSPSGATNLTATDVCETITISDNIYYGLASNLNWNTYNTASTVYPTNQQGKAVKNSQTKLETSPFDVYEPAEGIFKPVAEYANLGCQLE